MSEIYADIEEERLCAYGLKFVLADVCKTEVEAHFGIYHLIFYATAQSQTRVETVQTCIGCFDAVYVDTVEGTLRHTLVVVAGVNLRLAAHT